MKANPHFVRLVRLVGLDRAIVYTLVGRGWSVVAGPVTVAFIASFLSLEEQGFYYTFASVLGLQVFFELGLSYVILQFASHEKVHLEWTDDGRLTGAPEAKARLASLLRTALLWYSVIAVLAAVVLLPTGMYFFSTSRGASTLIAWHIPWTGVVLAAAGNLIVTPLLAVLEGCGLVTDIALMRIGQNILGNLLLWAALSLGFGLLAAPTFSAVALLWAVAWLVVKQRMFLRDIFDFRTPDAGIRWQSEVWPFQWKMAISALSGYFIFQLFNPILFAFRGAGEAGQMGMSLSITGAISAMAIAWVNTKAAPFGQLIAKRQFKQLDQLFFPALWQSLMVVSLGGVALWLGGLYLHYIHHPLSLRLLPPTALGLLVLTAIVNHIVFAEAAYLRAHKQEPFLAISVLIGILVGMSSLVLGRSFGALGMMLGYCLINVIVGLGFGSAIFRHKRRLWHQDVAIEEPACAS